MGERLAAGNVAVALLANTIATGATLTAVILAFASISGAHFNPLVTALNVNQGTLDRADALAYVVAQVIGAVIGVAAANLMFGEPALRVSEHVRAGWRMGLSEAVVTFGLLVVIRCCSLRRSNVVALAVGAYITGGYWFTASTCFANPAVTLARSLSDTFAGIRPADVPLFIAAQAAGFLAALAFLRWLEPAVGGLVAEPARRAAAMALEETR